MRCFLTYLLLHVFLHCARLGGWEGSRWGYTDTRLYVQWVFVVGEGPDLGAA